MDALVIGPPHQLTGAVTRTLRGHGHSVLRVIPADASDRDRIDWLLHEAGRPELIVIFDEPPYATAHELIGRTRADVVLVAEYRAPAAGAAPRSFAPWPIGRGLKVVRLGRAGRRWFTLGPKRAETLSAERAAAIVVRACRLPASALAA